MLDGKIAGDPDEDGEDEDQKTRSDGDRREFDGRSPNLGDRLSNDVVQTGTGDEEAE